jgi:hypothetical protein
VHAPHPHELADLAEDLNGGFIVALDRLQRSVKVRLVVLDLACMEQLC